jgi:hypothetical protein
VRGGLSALCPTIGRGAKGPAMAVDGKQVPAQLAGGRRHPTDPAIEDAVRGLRPIVSQTSRFSERPLYLLGGFYLVAGALLIVLGRVSTGDSPWASMINDIGIGLVGGAITAITLTYFANKILEGQVSHRIDVNMLAYLERVESATESFLRQLPEAFGRDLKQVTEDLKRFVPLFGTSHVLGLVSVHLTRTDALDGFMQYVKDEIDYAHALVHRRRHTDGDVLLAETGRLWFVSSSMMGFLTYASKDFDGKRALRQAANLAKAEALDLRIMMTHPRRADERADQESRRPDAIPGEIRANIDILRDLGVEREWVRLVDATPTVFAIGTREVLLLNPYPYGQEAYRAFCLVVQRTPEPETPLARSRDIYQQYEEQHFAPSWEQGIPITAEEWEQPSLIGTGRS